MSVAKLSSKSQIVVPAEVRRRLGLRPGDEVAIEVEGDHAVLRKHGTSAVEALKAVAAECAGLFDGYIEELDRARDEWDR